MTTTRFRRGPAAVAATLTALLILTGFAGATAAPPTSRSMSDDHSDATTSSNYAKVPSKYRGSGELYGINVSTQKSKLRIDLYLRQVAADDSHSEQSYATTFFVGDRYYSASFGSDRATVLKIKAAKSMTYKTICGSGVSASRVDAANRAILLVNLSCLKTGRDLRMQVVQVSGTWHPKASSLANMATQADYMNQLTKRGAVRIR